MGDWKDRIPLQNGKNNVLKFALSAGMTHEQLLAALIDGTFADVFYNQALPGTADAGVAQIGTVANKAFFDALVEECNALSNNLSYDVKMLQLQQILEGNHPNMMGGMIEAFYTTDNLQTREKVTVTTGASGKCAFDGTVSEPSSWDYGGDYNKPSGGIGTDVIIATGIQGNFKSVSVSIDVNGGYIRDEMGSVLPPTVKFIRCNTTSGVATIDYEFGVIPMNYHEIPFEYHEGVASFSNISAGGVTEFGILFEAAQYQGVYNGFSAMSDPGTNREYAADRSQAPSVFEPAPHKMAATIYLNFSGVLQPADGTVATKSTNLVSTVGGGAVYLHHSAIPNGASLTPKIQLGSNGWTALERDEKVTNRSISIGGRAAYETRYWLPSEIQEASTAALQVVGHRSSVSQKLELYDMMFAGR